MKTINKILAAFMLVACVAVPNAHAILVDTELSLLVDISSSINATEFNLQKTGYADAFTDPAVISAIQSGTNGAIAVNLIYWSSAGDQQQVVGWTLINDSASATAFANAVLATSRPFSGTTAPGSAINFGVPLFNNNGFEGTDLVIDVSGDGEQNSGANTATARNAAATAGITINGLAIGNSSLVNWYSANVKTADGFVVQATDFESFGDAIKEKIKTEVGPENPPPANAVPEPASMLLMGSGLVGAFLRKRKK